MADLVVPGCWRVGFGFMNAYIVDTGSDQLTVIDAASPWFGQARRIVRAASAAGYSANDVGDILITHQHIDHAGGAAGVADATGARVHIHELDAPELARGTNPKDGSGKNWFTSLIARGSNLFSLRAAEVHHHPSDGEKLSMGLTAIHTPGHTAGHMSYHWPAHGGVLFVGDVIGNWLGRLGDTPVAADWGLVREAARKLAELEFEVAVFGHGRPIRREARAAVRDHVAKL